jgi:hypothetical protein
MAKPFKPVVRFGPPAVEHGEVEATVEHHLLAAGARRLQRAPWVVEPHVHTLHQVAADVDVVILHEDELVGEAPRLAHHLGNLLEHALAGLVVGMSLAGKEELHRALGVVDHGGQPLGYPQAPGWRACRWRTAARKPMVNASGESTLPSDLQYLGRFAAPFCLFARAPPHKVEQAAPSGSDASPKARRRPPFSICLPGARRRPLLLLPAHSEMAIVKAAHLRRQPRRNVNAIGDVADGHCVFRAFRDKAASTSPATPRHAAKKLHWRAAKASAPARSCRIARHNR